MSKVNQSVLIVGAGPSGSLKNFQAASSIPDILPTGLALALLLLRNGLSVRIIEKNTHFARGQRGAGIMPRTLELYKILGVLSEFENLEVSPIPPMRTFTSPEGDGPVSQTHFIEKLPDQPNYHRINGFGTGQDDHMAFLGGVIESEYGRKVEFSTELVKFEQSETNVVAHVKSSNSEVAEEVKFDYLVGADGARSSVRKSLGLSFHGETFEENTFLVGDIEVKKGWSNEYWNAWGNTNTRFVTLRPYKRGGTDYNFFVIGGIEIDHDKALVDRDYLVEQIYTTIGKDRGLEFGGVVANAIWTAKARMVESYGTGRVFLAGDAAHIHSPTGAQGLNSGVQDCFNLAWKLSLVQKQHAPQSLLESYTAERIPVISNMLNFTTDLMRQAFSQSGTTLGLMNDNKAFDMRQLGINYRASPIVLDEYLEGSPQESVDPYRDGHDLKARAGDRAPEAPGLVRVQKGEKITVALYDLLDVTSHTVLIFGEPGSDTQAVLDHVKSYPQGTVKCAVVLPQGSDVCQGSLGKENIFVLDQEGHAYKHYHALEEEQRIVAIRPDGYIGAAVRGQEGLKRYLSGLLVRRTCPLKRLLGKN
ncbi:hypothetical protein AAF712_009037 [Marasmius tenuissimus]|uniref:FAD-binding domain-containing protein n=1 Tax=Marasmius tenuissimus TaxID=585030 RepID=A0ABR2ZQW3_9AGAR